MKRFVAALFVALGLFAAGVGIASAEPPPMTHDSPGMTHD
jgi:hypothetical protein